MALQRRLANPGSLSQTDLAIREHMFYRQRADDGLDSRHEVLTAQPVRAAGLISSRGP